MSLARKNGVSTSMIQAFFGSLTRSNKHSLNLSTRVKLILLGSLGYLQTAQAAYSDTVYAQEPSSNTHFQIDFNAIELPEMKSRLMEFCNMILFDAPQALYAHASTPQCESDSGQMGPMANVAVEVGKNITQSFMSCFGNGMQGMCDEYFDRQETASAEDGAIIAAIVLGSFILMCAIGIFVFLCCQRACRNREEGRSILPFYSTGTKTPSVSTSSYSTFSSGSRSNYSDSCSTSSPVIYTPSPVIVVAEPVHDHSHHSSVVWHH
jgi:hypothetical protein